MLHSKYSIKHTCYSHITCQGKKSPAARSTVASEPALIGSTLLMSLAHHRTYQSVSLQRQVVPCPLAVWFLLLSL